MKIKQLFMNNKGLKLTAFLLAVSVWVLISGSERTYLEKNFTINIEHVNTSELIDVQNRPDTVRLLVRGTTEVIAKISEKDFGINVDLKDVTASTNLTMFTEDHMTHPDGIEIISVTPKIFEVIVREFMYKEVPVRVLYTGRLPNGVALLDRQITPEKVRIFGYKTELQNIDTVYCSRKIDLSGIQENTVIKLPLEKSAEILRFEGVDSVDVSLTIKNIDETRK